MNPFKMFVITDTHYFASSLGCRGEEYDSFMQFEQKCFAETEAINKAAFKWLGESDDADTVLIAGDLSFNGEKQSHKEFSELLKKLKESGKRIFVITAGHDFNEIAAIAREAVKTAHIEGGVPNLAIEVTDMAETGFAELVCFFELACGISGYMEGVNPFDQPGVEAYKKLMFRGLAALK